MAIVPDVSTPEEIRKLGQVFDGVAEAYDEARAGYPEALVDRALRRGAIEAGTRVLEIGCGTGKLTELLAAHELEIDAVDPGPNMIEAARRRVGGAANVHFRVGRFEELELPVETYAAIFSATAFHWLEPAVAWRKCATLLRPDGLLALLTHRGVPDGRTKGIDAEFRAILRKYAPAIADSIPPDRSLAEILAGAEDRRANASEVWDWMMGGRHGLAVPEAASLFRDVELTSEIESVERTTDDLTDHLKTTSLYFSIDPDQRDAFVDEDRALTERYGGTVEFSHGTFLMTALRRPSA